MPTLDIEVRGIAGKRENARIVDVDVETADGARVQRRLYLDEIDTVEKLATWLLRQDLTPPSHVTALEGAYRITYYYEIDAETGLEYPVLDSVTAT